MVNIALRERLKALLLIALIAFGFGLSPQCPRASADPVASGQSSPVEVLSESQRADQEAAEFLRRYRIIRIGMTEATGNGHQAYAVTVMKRLRELGFKGRIEIFYSPGVNKKQLEYLLPGFKADGPDYQVLAGALGQVNVVRWDDSSGNLAAKYKYGKVALGVMGGDDKSTKPSELNVDALIRVQPSGWRRDPSIDYKENDKSFGVGSLPTKVSAPEIKDFDAFLRAQLEHAPTLAAKIPGIRALIGNFGRVDTLAAYGLGFNGPKRLANLIVAIDLARRKKPEMFKGPVVIPFLSSFNEEEWSIFHKHLEGFAGQKPPLTIQNSSNAKISETIRDLKNEEILLMPVGIVPQDIWNLLIDRSTLPPTVAGTTGTNFARARGRPFINTVSNAKALEKPYAGDLKIDELHSAVLDANYKGHDHPDFQPSLQALSGFILDSLDPSSEVSRRFQHQRNSINALPDKVSAVLANSKKYLEDEILAQDDEHLDVKALNTMIDGLAEISSERRASILTSYLSKSRSALAAGEIMSTVMKLDMNSLSKDARGALLAAWINKMADLSPKLPRQSMSLIKIFGTRSFADEERLAGALSKTLLGGAPLEQKTAFVRELREFDVPTLRSAVLSRLVRDGGAGSEAFVMALLSGPFALHAARDFVGRSSVLPQMKARLLAFIKDRREWMLGIDVKSEGFERLPTQDALSILYEQSHSSPQRIDRKTLRQAVTKVMARFDSPTSLGELLRSLKNRVGADAAQSNYVRWVSALIPKDIRFEGAAQSAAMDSDPQIRRGAWEFSNNLPKSEQKKFLMSIAKNYQELCETKLSPPNGGVNELAARLLRLDLDALPAETKSGLANLVISSLISDGLSDGAASLASRLWNFSDNELSTAFKDHYGKILFSDGLEPSEKNALIEALSRVDAVDVTRIAMMLVGNSNEAVRHSGYRLLRSQSNVLAVFYSKQRIRMGAGAVKLPSPKELQAGLHASNQVLAKRRSGALSAKGSALGHMDAQELLYTLYLRSQAGHTTEIDGQAMQRLVVREDFDEALENQLRLFDSISDKLYIRWLCGFFEANGSKLPGSLARAAISSNQVVRASAYSALGKLSHEEQLDIVSDLGGVVRSGGLGVIYDFLAFVAPLDLNNAVDPDLKVRIKNLAKESFEQHVSDPKLMRIGADILARYPADAESLAKDMSIRYAASQRAAAYLLGLLTSPDSAMILTHLATSSDLLTREIAVIMMRKRGLSVGSRSNNDCKTNLSNALRRIISSAP